MKDFSIYTGIVIQNDDPDQCGKVKVFVPGITNTIYDGWNNINSDKTITNISGDITSIMGTLKEDLPWAQCASSIFGGDTSQINYKSTPVSLQRASSAMELSGGEPSDAFEHKLYRPGNYSGTSAGFYSIPSVGSHVYVFFKRGDTNYPVYIAGSHGVDEWKSIMKDNYPTDYENSETSKAVYENKHVLNSSKHTLEFIDSDDKEEIKISHYIGSNIQMLNDYTSIFTVGNHYDFIQVDDFYTIGGDSTGVISGNFIETIKQCVTTNIEMDNTNNIIGSRTTSITGAENITIGADRTVGITGAESVSVGGGQTIDVTGNVTIKASGSITIESAGGKIVLDGGGVTITGAAINLN